MINTSRYRIICIGKVKKKWIQTGIDNYLRRMPGLIIIELKDSDKKKEASNIKSRIHKNERIVLLQETGNQLTSKNLSTKLNEFNNDRIVFIIGGANGLDPDLNKVASWDLSLSKFTFPHEIARLLLVEQIYRAQTISEGSPYHRD